MKSKWTEYKLCDFAQINPTERLSKGSVSKKIAMEALSCFRKKIPHFSNEKYKGGVKFRNGDTLMARITPSLENGKISFVDILLENEIGFGSTEFIVFREKNGISNKHYIYYLITSPIIRNIAIQSMTGTSGRQRVQTDVVKNHIFLAPPLPEQKAIAQILSSLDDKIELNRQMNQTLEQMAQAMFKSWFVDKPKKEWKEISLSERIDFLNGLACQKYPPLNNEERLPVLKIKQLRNGFSNDCDWCADDVKPDYIIKNGDIIFSWSASLMVKIWDGETCILNQHLFKVTSDEFPKWFIYYWCKYHLDKFINISKSMATTMGHIKRKDLDDSMIIVPSKNEINSFSEQMNPIINKLITNSQQLEKLIKLRDTLLPKLISGELRVPDELIEKK